MKNREQKEDRTAYRTLQIWKSGRQDAALSEFLLRQKIACGMEKNSRKQRIYADATINLYENPEKQHKIGGGCAAVWVH